MPTTQSTATPPSVPPGLKGVSVTDTTIGDVRGPEGFYHYRQYSATELAERRSLEDVWQLLFDGSLPPDATTGATFAAEVRAARPLPAKVRDLLPGIAATTQPPGSLFGLRTALSAFGSAVGMRPLWDVDPATRRGDLVRLAAVTPTLVAALYRLESGSEPVDPDPDLGHAANYLWMVTGSPARAVPGPCARAVPDPYASTTASTRRPSLLGSSHRREPTRPARSSGPSVPFPAPCTGVRPVERWTPSTPSAPPTGRTATSGTRSGAASGSWDSDMPCTGPRIPARPCCAHVALSLGGDLVELAVDVERTILEVLAELKPEQALYANVEYYAGVVMDRCGLPRDLFTPTFAVSRMIGWCANIAEQADERRLIRPAAHYVGPPAPEPVPAVA